MPKRISPYLTKKIFEFSTLYIAIQLIPILVEPFVHNIILEKNGNSNIPINIATVFVLSGSAWLSIPSFIDSYEWSNRKSKRSRRIAIFTGALLILIGAFFKTIQSTGADLNNKIPSSFFVGLTSFIFAISYIVISHFRTLKKISLRLLWKHQSQFAGIYAAKESGIFERAGLLVTIKKPNINTNPIYDFDGSDDDFAIVAGMDVIRMRDNNQKIKSILPIVKTNPFTIIARQDGKIKSIKDLKGKKVAIQKDYEIEIYFKEVIKQYELSLNDFIVIEAAYDYNLFISGDVDIWLGYDGCEPQLFRRNNIPIIEFKLNDLNIPGYGDTLVTEEVTISTCKPIVRAFVDSVLQGWLYAKENREETLKYTIRYSEEEDKIFEKNSLNTMIHLIFYSEKQINSPQKVDDWLDIIELLNNSGYINKEVVPTELFLNV